MPLTRLGGENLDFLRRANVDLIVWHRAFSAASSSIFLSTTGISLKTTHSSGAKASAKSGKWSGTGAPGARGGWFDGLKSIKGRMIGKIFACLRINVLMSYFPRCSVPGPRNKAQRLKPIIIKDKNVNIRCHCNLRHQAEIVIVNRAGWRIMNEIFQFMIFDLFTIYRHAVIIADKKRHQPHFAIANPADHVADLVMKMIPYQPGKRGKDDRQNGPSHGGFGSSGFFSI